MPEVRSQASCVAQVGDPGPAKHLSHGLLNPLVGMRRSERTPVWAKHPAVWLCERAIQNIWAPEKAPLGTSVDTDKRKGQGLDTPALPIGLLPTIGFSG
jgi:hypothetical protein